jgi:hypothetical protein
MVLLIKTLRIKKMIDSNKENLANSSAKDGHTNCHM